MPKKGIGRSLWWLRDPFDSLFLVFHGGSRMFRSWNLTFAYALLIALVFFVALKPLNIVAADKVGSYVYSWLALLAIAIFFSKPSRYALTGFTQKEVLKVVDQIPNLEKPEKSYIQAVKCQLQRAEGDTKARLTTIKWVAGIPYAVFIYMVQKGFDATDGNLMSQAVVPLMIAVFVGLFIAMHSRAIEAIYGLAFSVVDQLESRSDKKISSQASYKQRMRQRIESSK